MKNFLLRLLLVSMALAFQAAANGAGEQPVEKGGTPQREELSSKIGGASEIYPEAIGEWKYQLVSEDAVIGDMKVTVAKETLYASACYRMEQTGTFAVSATETRRIQTTAHLRPDLTLIDYERSEETLENGRSKNITRVQAEVGATAIAFLKDAGGGKPVKSEIKKTGPIYYAPGAAWILLRTSNLKPGQSYRFDNWLPESGDIREATIDAEIKSGHSRNSLNVPIRADRQCPQTLERGNRLIS